MGKNHTKYINISTGCSYLHWELHVPYHELVMEVVRLVNLVASYHPLNTPTRKDGGHQVEENKIDEVQHAGTHRYMVDEMIFGWQ